MSSCYPKRIPDDRDRRKSSDRNIGTSEDGSSSSKSNKGSYSALDPTTLKLTKESPVSPIPATDDTVPIPVESMPFPLPIADSEILRSIPVPEESFDNFLRSQNAISFSEPTSENSSVSPTSTENEDKDNVFEYPSKIVFKYSYKEDQWSPLNPEGKKQYDRNFLLQLQCQPMSLCKPKKLPNLDVVKDKAHIQRLSEFIPKKIRTYNDPFMPNYAGESAARLPHPAVNRRSQQGKGGEKPKKFKSFTASLASNIKLHESENAWKLHNKLSLTDIAQDDLKREKLKRSVQGILNKLTPQKFETLLTQLKGLNTDTEEKLNVVTDLIIKNAIVQPNFNFLYANLCKHLALIKVPLADQTGGQVNFRKMLLTKCLQEFEQDRSHDLKHVERIKAVEEDVSDNQKEMKLEYYWVEKKMNSGQLRILDLLENCSKWA